jgi:hypothetical protein
MILYDRNPTIIDCGESAADDFEIVTFALVGFIRQRCDIKRPAWQPESHTHRHAQHGIDACTGWRKLRFQSGEWVFSRKRRAAHGGIRHWFFRKHLGAANVEQRWGELVCKSSESIRRKREVFSNCSIQLDHIAQSQHCQFL